MCSVTTISALSEYQPFIDRSPKALVLATSDLGGESVETPLPEATEPVKPGVYLLQGPGLDRVYAARTLVPHSRKSALAKHAQVLRHSRLRNTLAG
jgi:hypothetical protein